MHICSHSAAQAEAHDNETVLPVLQYSIDDVEVMLLDTHSAIGGLLMLCWTHVTCIDKCHYAACSLLCCNQNDTSVSKPYMVYLHNAEDATSNMPAVSCWR